MNDYHTIIAENIFFPRLTGDEIQSRITKVYESR